MGNGKKLLAVLLVAALLLPGIPAAVQGAERSAGCTRSIRQTRDTAGFPCMILLS